MRKYMAVFFISAICLVTTIAQGRVVQLRRTNGAWEYNEQGNTKREINISVNTNKIVADKADGETKGGKEPDKILTERQLISAIERIDYMFDV